MAGSILGQRHEAGLARGSDIAVLVAQRPYGGGGDTGLAGHCITRHLPAGGGGWVRSVSTLNGFHQAGDADRSLLKQAHVWPDSLVRARP
ncbi:hypothetical protein LY78DRAFT_324247 [Colletotrichum sublineola]|nr:hypothetical protein LY78DRAFT_324247 [Colletotrichum sublineola]